MDANVTVEEMVDALESAAQMDVREARSVTLFAERVRAARDYIIAAESQIAERDAQIAHLERKFPCGHRFYDWASPEESCVACAAKEFYERACDGYDAQIAEKDAALYAYESEVLAAGFGTIAEMVAQIAEMRKVTGPPCPKCDHWLKAEHTIAASVRCNVCDSVMSVYCGSLSSGGPVERK